MACYGFRLIQHHRIQVPRAAQSSGSLTYTEIFSEITSDSHISKSDVIGDVTTATKEKGDRIVSLNLYLTDGCK
nr:hypothetical protein [Nostoc sp. FACHB-110]